MAAARVQLAAVRGATLQRSPYPWAAVDNAVPAAAAAELAAGFPEEGFDYAEHDGDEKPYRLWHRQLAVEGEDNSACELAPAWREFATSLLDPSYRDAVATLAGLDLSRTRLELTLWRYPTRCWLGPHVDKAEKVVTQIFYFNPGWEPAWGGALRILRSRHDGDVAAAVVPRLGASAVLVRSPTSWHAVAPVTRGSRTRARRSLTAIFHRGD